MRDMKYVLLSLSLEPLTAFSCHLNGMWEEAREEEKDSRLIFSFRVWLPLLLSRGRVVKNNQSMTFSQMQSKYFLSRQVIVKATVEGREVAGYLWIGWVPGWMTPGKPTQRPPDHLGRELSRLYRVGRVECGSHSEEQQRKGRVFSRSGVI